MVIALKFIFYFTIFLSIWFSLFNRKKLLLLYAITLPFYTIQFDFGQQITNSRFIEILMFLTLIISGSYFKMPKYLLIFITYSILLTLIWFFFLPENYLHLFPPLRGKYRFLSQVPYLLFKVSPLMFTMQTIKKEKDLSALFSFLNYAIFTLSILGLLQFLIFYRSGVDIFPLGILGDTQRTGIIAGNIIRVSSLGGEPKHFANSLVTLITILISLRLSPKTLFTEQIKLNKNWVIIFYLIMLFMTLSTSGLSVLAIDLMILPFILVLAKGKISKAVIIYIGALVLFGAMIASSSYVSDLILLRTVDRISESGAVEDGSEAIFEFLKENPLYILTGTGLGQIHIFIQDYINPIYVNYAYGNVLEGRYGFLELISNGGIIALILFVIVYMRPTLFFLKNKALINRIFFIALLIITLLNFLLYAKNPINNYFLLGLAYTNLKIEENNLNEFFKK